MKSSGLKDKDRVRLKSETGEIEVTVDDSKGESCRPGSCSSRTAILRAA